MLPLLGLAAKTSTLFLAPRPKHANFCWVWLPSDRKLLHRQGRRSFDRGDAVLHRLLHLLERAHGDLAHALSRDAELVGEFRERDRVFGEPTRFEDAPLAIVEHGERRGERLAAVVELVARGERSLLAGTLVNQPVQPFAGIAVRANRRVERGVAAEPPVHVDHVLLRDAEPL